MPPTNTPGPDEKSSFTSTFPDGSVKVAEWKRCDSVLPLRNPMLPEAYVSSTVVSISVSSR